MMTRKLRTRRGFTLIEVLCSILVLAFSGSLLCTGIGAAGSINQQARITQEAFYAELSVAEGNTVSHTEGAARFYAVDPSGVPASTSYGERTILFYAKDGDALKSYRLRP